MWNNELEYTQATFFGTISAKTLFMVDGFAGIYKKAKNGSGGKGVTIDAIPFLQMYPDDAVFVREK